MYRRMRGWRHDYHNHMQVLKAHLGLGQYAEAQEYLKRLEEDLAGVDTVLKTGNVMVDAILNSKLTLIRERGIQRWMPLPLRPGMWESPGWICPYS